MTDWLLSTMVVWGVPVIGIATFLSCLALPVPSSLIMLTGGAITLSGDLSLTSVVAAALTGAILGDQAGYLIGNRMAGQLTGRLQKHSPKAALLKRACDFSDRYGRGAVFLSRWLFSPLGPYVNLIAGATNLDRMRFLLWSASGEAVWVMLYVGTGRLFASNISAVADLAGNASGFLAGLAVTVVIGLMLRARLRPHPNRQAKSATRLP